MSKYLYLGVRLQIAFLLPFHYICYLAGETKECTELEFISLVFWHNRKLQIDFCTEIYILRSLHHAKFINRTEQKN